MEFFTTAVSSLSTVVTAKLVPVSACGALSTLWKDTGEIILASKSQGVKQLMAGGGSFSWA